MIQCVRLTLLVMFLACALISMGGCQAILPAPKYSVAFSTPRNEPVFIEEVVYDGAWHGRCGVLLCCWKEARKKNVISPRPVPRIISIRWFNYRQQKFYEATVDLPASTAATLRRLPKPEFGSYKLTTGVQPDGIVVVWVSNGSDERTGTWIEVARDQGHQAEGNPGDYKSQTEDMRQRGEI